MSADPDGVPDPGTRDEQPRRRRWRGLSGVLRETILIVGSALVLSLLIKTFLAQAFFIPSASMQDTLVEGDRVVVSKLSPGMFDLDRGDIVVFRDPDGWLGPAGVPETSRPILTEVLTFVGLLPPDAGEHLIKRVIGLPGDRVVCCDAGGRIEVNGSPVVEPYLKPGSVPSESSFDVVVPAERLWVMGDNRQNSQDSRAHLGEPGGGMVPIDEVVGRAVVVMWPVDRLAVLRNPSAVFDDVPDPAP